MTTGISGLNPVYKKFPEIGEEVRKISAALSAIEAGGSLAGGFLPYAYACQNLALKASRGRDPDLKEALLQLSKRVQAAYAKSAPSELLKAIRDNDPKACEKILVASQLRNRPLSNGEMPLHYAIRCGSEAVVKHLLLQSLADPLAKDHQALSAFDHAFLTHDPAMIRLVIGSSLRISVPESVLALDPDPKELQKLGADLKTLRHPPVSQLKPVQAAAFSGDLQELEALSRKEAINTPDQTGMTALHYAVLGGNDEAVAYLVRKGGKLQGTMANGMTFLHLAAISGSETVLKQVLAMTRIDPNTPDQHGRTPLHFALAADQLQIARLLIERGGDPFASTMRTAPFSILKTLSQIRAETRDPLKLDMPAVFTFGAYAGAALCSVLGNLAGSNNLATTQQALQSAGNILKAVPVFQTILGNAQSGPIYQRYPAMLAFPYAITSYAADVRHGKALLEGGQSALMVKKLSEKLKACWKNSAVETFRPARNAMIHLANAAFAVWHAVQTSGLKKQFVCTFGGEETCLLQPELNPSLDPSCNSSRMTPEQVKECSAEALSDAELIFGLGGYPNTPAKKALRAVGKRWHPDTNQGVSDLFIKKINSARDTFKTLRRI